MGKIGSGELIVILLVALLIFGPAKLPALGKMAGKAVGTLKHYADSTNWDELMEEEEPEEKASEAKKATEAESAEAAEEGKEEQNQEDPQVKQAS